MEERITKIVELLSAAYLPEKNDILEMMLKLGPEQKIACDKVFKFCTESVIAQRLFEKNPESDFKPDTLKLIVHGGAGI